MALCRLRFDSQCAKIPVPDGSLLKLTKFTGSLMILIGFSTGALALGDFPRALGMLTGKSVNAVELSALRTHELPHLVAALGALDLRQYEYVSVHAPSRFSEDQEPDVVELLKPFMAYRWPIILHPDAIHNAALWTQFGDVLCIENMDKRKAVGRSVAELEPFFDKLPEARFCFDIAHARQVDSSMTEAYMLLKAFGNRLRQIHISEVNSSSKHDRISRGAVRTFKEVSHLIPPTVPVILETPVVEAEIEEEIKRASDALSSSNDAIWTPATPHL